MRRYWVDDDLIYAQGGKLYILSGGDLQRILLRDTHDSRWAGHPGVKG